MDALVLDVMGLVGGWEGQVWDDGGWVRVVRVQNQCRYIILSLVLFLPLFPFLNAIILAIEQFLTAPVPLSLYSLSSLCPSTRTNLKVLIDDISVPTDIDRRVIAHNIVFIHWLLLRAAFVFSRVASQSESGVPESGVHLRIVHGGILASGGRRLLGTELVEVELHQVLDQVVHLLLVVLQLLHVYYVLVL